MRMKAGILISESKILIFLRIFIQKLKYCLLKSRSGFLKVLQVGT